MTAVIIGNGRSRLRFDLEKLGQQVKTYGCNALYRDYLPDFLVAVDKPMIDEILLNQVYYRTEVYLEDRYFTGTLCMNKCLNRIETNIPGYMDSGTLASIVAISHGHKELYLLGFDFISGTEWTNNVYAGTPNYRAQTDRHVLDVTEQSWYYRSIILALRHPDVTFYRVNTNNYIPPFHCDNYKNITLEEFLEKFPDTYDKEKKIREIETIKQDRSTSKFADNTPHPSIKPPRC